MKYGPFSSPSSREHISGSHEIPRCVCASRSPIERVKSTPGTDETAADELERQLAEFDEKAKKAQQEANDIFQESFDIETHKAQLESTTDENELQASLERWWDNALDVRLEEKKKLEERAVTRARRTRRAKINPEKQNAAALPAPQSLPPKVWNAGEDPTMEA